MDTKRLDELLQGMIDHGELPMASLLVTQHGGEVYRGVFGYQDVDTQKPLEDDTIYRIFSMTKVVTTVAMLQLIERGLLSLEDPTYDFLPGFRDQQVVTTDFAGRWSLRPAASMNTVRTLLTMTSGIPYYHAGRCFSEDAMSKLYETINTSPQLTTVEAVNLIGKNPLAFDPGHGFYYGLSMEVIAAIVEIVSGKRFGQYCRDHIFEPLGMQDTGFYVPEEKKGRLSSFYSRDKAGVFQSGLTAKDDRQLSPPAFEEGGDGIVTTTRDYNRFVQMLAAGGISGQERILSAAMLEKMSQNHLRGTVLEQAEKILGRMDGAGCGYGFGVKVLQQPAVAPVLCRAGTWGWYGKGGSWFCVDPASDLTIVWNMQDISENARRHRVRAVNAVYGALSY